MTSPSTRNVQNGSLLAKFNEITDKLQDTCSPGVIIPYPPRKYAPNRYGDADNDSESNKLNQLFPTVPSRQGDGSNCSSSVSRFITSKQADLMK